VRQKVHEFWLKPCLMNSQAGEFHLWGCVEPGRPVMPLTLLAFDRSFLHPGALSRGHMLAPKAPTNDSA
jgi:hypothetical protein